jgi:hypothetical protein
MNGRPLVYLYLAGEAALPRRFGSWEAAKQAFGQFREQARSAGAGDPYLVLQDWSVDVAARRARDLGFDAISAYATTGGGKGEQPYAVLAAHVRGFWEQCRRTGMPVVPLVMAGWDRRPRIENPVPWEKRAPGESVESALHFTPASPAELAGSLAAAIAWSDNHPKASLARAVLIYAWNEVDEGGWLVPTLAEQDARLKAIGGVLRRRAASEAARN